MSDLLKIGYSGTLVSQQGLLVTGNNVSNINTPGYSRQRVEQSTQPHHSVGGLHFGLGATTDAVKRITNQFLDTQLRADTSAFKQQEAFLNYAKQLDNLLADPSSSPGQALNKFFAAVESLNNEPNSQPLRELVLSEADTLAKRFNMAYERYGSIRDSLNTQLQTSMQEVNQLARSIAALNEDIIAATAKSAGLPPNDLLDMREEKLRALSEYVDVKATAVANGSVNVVIGDGFPLVIGAEAFDLKTAQSDTVQEELEIYYVGKDGDKKVSDLINGGSLGGLLSFRADVLSPAINQLGRLAVTVAETFNAQHKLGIDLNNELGGNFFRDVNEDALMSGRVVQHNANNSRTNISLGLRIEDPSALTDKNYQLVALTGGASATFSLYDDAGNPVRFTDHSTTPTTYKTVATLQDFKDGTVSVDGFRPVLTAPDTADRVFAGDRFSLMPTRQGAADFRREISSGNEIAFASPLQIDAALSNDGSGHIAGYAVKTAYASAATPSPNGSTGSDYAFIDQATGRLKRYDDATGASVDLPAGLEIGFTAGDTYEIRDPSSTPATVLYSGSFAPGMTQNIIPEAWGFEVRLGGSPASDDTFAITFNSDGAGDNGNGLALSSLQAQGILEGGQVNYQDGYAKIAEFVGIHTAEAKVNAEAGSAILDQTKALRESVSGVNLDEEAANLVRYQQAYNASAQLISVAQQIFDTLIAAVGR